MMIVRLYAEARQSLYDFVLQKMCIRDSIMAIYPKLIMDALAKVRYPGTGKDLVEMGMVCLLYTS